MLFKMHCLAHFCRNAMFGVLRAGQTPHFQHTLQRSCVSVGLCPFGKMLMTDGRSACWCRDAMLAALSAGRTLVVDRYAYSGAAFTAAKGVPGLDLAWCKVAILSRHTSAASLDSASLIYLLGTSLPSHMAPHWVSSDSLHLQLGWHSMPTA